jgi:hypothetical protein
VEINNAIRLLVSVLLVGISADVLCAQGASGPTGSASNGSLVSVTATPMAPLADNPPRAPRVTCDGGQLRISANNSTLVSILTAVHACIGVQIDIPAGAGSSRTFEELGPGPEREVLESLLSGTDFNYVIGSTDENPQKVETVLLMQRTTEVAANAPPTDRPLTAARRAWMESRQNLRRAGTTGEETPQAADDVPESPPPVDEATTSGAADASNANTTQASASDAPAPAAAEAQPSTAPQGGAMISTAITSETQSTSPVSNPALDSGKSTAERIADMQQMFEQRKQMTQSPNPGASLTQPTTQH